MFTKILIKKWTWFVLALVTFLLILMATNFDKVKAYFDDPPSAGHVTVYEHIETDAHTGASQEFGAGTCDQTCLGTWSASISSLQVGDGAEITLYAHPGCYAPLLTFSSDVSNLGDYPCDDPTYCPASRTWSDAARCIKVEVSGEADLVVDHLTVTRDDTGEELSSGDTVSDGTSIRIEAFVKNIGTVDAVDFYVEYYDNATYVDNDQETSVVSAGGNDIESESDTFTLSGAGQHTLRVDLDTTGVITESDENNNSESFVLNVSSVLCYDLSTNVDPAGSGTVSVTPSPNCNSTQYTAGTQVQLAASPASGYTFDAWTGDVTGDTSPVTTTMDRDKAVMANFVQLSTSGCAASAIDAYLAGWDSPLQGSGTAFVEAGQQYNVDPRLVVAIAGAESSFGKNLCPNQAPHNAWGWMWWPDGTRQCRPFASWSEGIDYVTNGLRRNYLDRGKDTIHAIGLTYCGEDCPNWAPNTRQFYSEQGGNPDTNDLTFNTNCGTATGRDLIPPTGYYVNPPHGLVVGDSVLLEAAASDQGGSGVDKVEFIVNYKGDQQTGLPIVVENLSDGVYGYTLDLSGRRDQDIALGLNVYDNAGNKYTMPMHDYRLIVKDTRGFLAQSMRQTASPIRVVAGGEPQFFQIVFKNIGQSAWSNMPGHSNFIGLFESDEPNLATCQGSNGKNNFSKFQFHMPYLDASPPLNQYGAAIAEETNVAPNGEATFSFRISAPAHVRSGRYRVDVALANATTGIWVKSPTSGNGCDYFARAWFEVEVTNPTKPSLPYIHQLWSTENDFMGYGACGPASLGMMLAWADALEPRALNNPPPEEDYIRSDYGWYVSNSLGEFNVPGYDLTSSYSSCTGKFYGLNGFVNPSCDYIEQPNGPDKFSSCHCGFYQAHKENIGLGASKLMPVLKNGNKYYWNNASETVIRNAVERDNHLVVMSTRLCNLLGHYVLVRGYENGAFIVSDPWGYCNGRTYDKRADGSDVRYTWSRLRAKGWYVESKNPIRTDPTFLAFQPSPRMARDTLSTSASLILYEIGRTTGFFSQTVSLSEPGIPLTDVTPGLYNVFIKPEYQLASQQETAIYSTSVRINIPETAVGDIDPYGGDNIINLLDLATLMRYWQQNSSQNPEAERADLNADGVVDASDFLLLNTNYGFQGEGPIGKWVTPEFTPTSTLRLSSEKSVYNVGDIITVAVKMDSITQTYGTEFVLHYDPTVLDVQDADLTQTGIQIKTGDSFYPVYLRNRVDVTTGQIFLAGHTELGDGFGQLGELAMITFTAMAPARETHLWFDFTLGSTADSNVILASSALDDLGRVENLALRIEGVDTVPPTGKLTIADGRDYISRTQVSLALYAADAYTDVTQMRFSFDGTYWTDWEPYTYSTTTTLPTGDGVKSVYASFKDAANNTTTVSSTIQLDTIPPTGTIRIAEVDEDYWVSFRIQPDDGSGDVDKLLISHDSLFTGAEWGDFTPYDLTYPLTEGDTIYIKLMDKAGNISSAILLNVQDIIKQKIYLPLLLKQLDL